MKILQSALENFIMLLLVGQVVVFRYFNVHVTTNKIIIVLIVISAFINLLSKKKKLMINWATTLIVIFMLLLIVLNGVLFGINEDYTSNLLMLLYLVIYMVYITCYVERHQATFYQRLYKMRYLINIYIILNIVVMLIQLQGTYFMTGYTNIINPFLPDLVSGLFGYSMTATVCYFSTFVITYNAVITRTIHNRQRKSLFIAYNILIALLMSYISTQNDNVQFFLFLALTLMVIMFSTYRINTASGLEKVFMIFIVCLFIVSTILLLDANIYTELNKRIFYKFTKAIDDMYLGSSVSGSTERLALVVFAFRYANGWILGNGFSSAGLYSPGAYGFTHFGNANVGALISLGGVWFYLSLILLYSNRIVTMIEYRSSPSHKSLYRIVIPLYFMATTLFTLPLSDTSIGLCVMFIMIVFGFNKYLDQQKKESML